MSLENPVQVDSWYSSNFLTGLQKEKLKERREIINQHNRIRQLQVRTGFCFECYSFGGTKKCWEKCRRFKVWSEQDGNQKF